MQSDRCEGNETCADSTVGGSFARGAAEKCLQITRLRDRRMDRMISGLAAAVEDLDEAAAVAGGGLDQVDEIVGPQMVGAGAAHQQRVALEQPHRDLIELSIRGLATRYVFFALDE